MASGSDIPFRAAPSEITCSQSMSWKVVRIQSGFFDARFNYIINRLACKRYVVGIALPINRSENCAFINMCSRTTIDKHRWRTRRLLASMVKNRTCGTPIHRKTIRHLNRRNIIHKHIRTAICYCRWRIMADMTSTAITFGYTGGHWYQSPRQILLIIS